MDVEPAEHGFGLFGADFGFPGGGLCLSVFLAVHRDGGWLAGQMSREHASNWIERWAPNVAFYEGDRRDRLFEGWRMPATYLRLGEHPREAAGRVWRDQLGFDGEPELSPVRIVSSAQPSRRSPGQHHWDVLFWYASEGPELPARPEHWAQLGYEAVGDLDAEQAVMLHGDLVAMLDPGEGPEGSGPP